MERAHTPLHRATRSFAVAAIAPYVAILALCAFLLYSAFGIAPAPEGQLGAAFWPRTVLTLAMLTCVFEIAWILRKARAEPAADELDPAEAPESPDEPGAEVRPWVPCLGIALTIAYVLLFSELGYFLATTLFVFAFICCGGYRRRAVAGGIALVASLAFVFIFMKIVYVSLPMGAEPFAHVSAYLMALMGIK